MRKRSTFSLGLVLLSWVSTGSSTEVIQFAGTFELRTDEFSRDILGNKVCFYPTPETARRAPGGKTNINLIWFCFSNSDRAKDVLGISRPEQTDGCGLKGSAEVSVSKYVAYLGEGDGFDSAELISAKAISPPTVIPCEL